MPVVIATQLQAWRGEQNPHLIAPVAYPFRQEHCQCISRPLGWLQGQGVNQQELTPVTDSSPLAISSSRMPEAKKGFVLLPRRWVVERSFAWSGRFRRLARDYERLASTLAGLHFVAFACVMLARVMGWGGSA